MQTKPSQADRIVLRHETKAAAAAAAAAGGEDSVGGTDSDSELERTVTSDAPEH